MNRHNVLEIIFIFSLDDKHRWIYGRGTGQHEIYYKCWSDWRDAGLLACLFTQGIRHKSPSSTNCSPYNG